MRTIQSIYLIGFMGSGKSTVGQALATKLNKTYIDTDQYIEEKYGSIPKIFRDKGEDVFRLYEMNALQETLHYQIISTGGGIVEKIENLHKMKENGIIFYLHTSFHEISKRLGQDKNRPLWNRALEENKKLYHRRIPKYEEFSDYKIITDGKTIQEIVHEIIKQSNV